ncbi:heme exporter protein CcmB [Myxococcota bacterium]|jgi:heme exporter protein CcmB|nr:heme exporter protein CcmB [Myxococcota bacterium]
MRSAWRSFRALVGKDLRVEFRTRDVLYTTGLFAMMLVVIFSFAFLSDPARARDYGPGIIWVTVLLATTVGQNRLFDRERENDCLWALLLSPVSPEVLFLAKVTAQLAFALLMQVPTLGLIVLFFDLRVVDPASFFGALLLGNLALGLVGTLFSAMLMNSRMKEVLLPLVTYPLLVPVLIAGVKVTALSLGAPVAEEPGGWLRFLVGFDMIFGVVTVLLFGRMIRA